MLIDGDDHPVGIEPELFGGRVEDAFIGLVRDDPIDLAGLMPGRFSIGRPPLPR